MGLFNKLFGPRWSLYIIKNANQRIYAMHENSVMRMLGYVIDYYSGGSRPVEPWSLHLIFNRTQQTIKLGSEHFTRDGENITPILIQQIESIDPGWKVKGAEPVFEEVATKKSIKLSSQNLGQLDIDAMLNNPREITFYSVMNQVFDRS